jgi:chorismate synthase
MLRFLTAGESHGPALTVIVEGLPAGLEVTVEGIAAELARRRLGFGRGPRMALERDDVELLGGVRHGRTLGSPVAVVIHNTEWPKWQEEMSPAPGVPARPLRQPRPGHADLVGMQKYGFDDARNVLERASARETAARVAAGALAKVLLDRLGVSLLSHVVALGPVRVGDDRPRPTPADRDRIDASPLRCADPDAEAAMRAEVEAATAAGDSLGGVVEVLGHGVPPGLGSHVHWDRRIDGRLAAALMSIQAMKGVEIGDGFAAAARRGSAAHDEILWSDAEGYTRASDRAGGVEGGMTTGGLLAVRVAMKPLATLRRPVLRTVDTATKEETRAFRERTDVTAVPAAGVVAEAMVALVLADEALRKFGGDSVAELVRNHDAYRASLR